MENSSLAVLQTRSDLVGGTLEFRNGTDIMQVRISSLAFLFPHRPGVQTKGKAYFKPIASGRHGKPDMVVRPRKFFPLGDGRVELNRRGRVRIGLNSSGSYALLFPAGHPLGLPN